MDCRTCQPTLIDLLYCELATDAAEAARAHLRECASCRASYDKLAAGLRVARTLETVEPPAHVEPKLLELAQARVIAVAAQRAAAAPPPPSAWQIAIDFMRRFATARQVGMVVVSMLIVTVGLTQFLHFSREVTSSPAPASVAQQVAEEAAPSDGVKPAEPLGLKMDAHSGRIRSAEDEAAMSGAAAASPAAAPMAATSTAHAGEADKRGARQVAVAEHRARPAAGARADLAAAKEEALVKGKQQPSALEDDLLSGSMMRAKPAAQPAPRPFPATPGALDRAEMAAPKKAARSTDTSGALGASPVAQSSGAGVASASTRTAEGKASSVDSLSLNAYRPSTAEPVSPSRSAPAAAPPPPSGLPAQLDAARAIAQRDGCTAGLSRYQAIVSIGGNTREAGEALLEMARCRASLGQTAAARALLERAAQIPAVATRARSMLSAPAPAAEPAMQGGAADTDRAR